MRSNFGLFFLWVGLLVVSCSKSDDNQEEFDPVFSQEYTKLKRLDELDNTFYYAGIKRGNAKASMLLPNAKNCRASEYFGRVYDDTNSKLDYGFIMFKEGDLMSCERTSSSFFTETSLLREGELLTTIRRGDFVRTGNYSYKVVLGERRFKGIVEIGFQGEYLRIEDQISNYVRQDPNEKVYLYFKK